MFGKHRVSVKEHQSLTEEILLRQHSKKFPSEMVKNLYKTGYVPKQQYRDMTMATTEQYL
jgi:hypothetical protein